MEYTVTIPVGWVLLVLFLLSVVWTLFVYVMRTWYWWNGNKQAALEVVRHSRRQEELRLHRNRWYRNWILVRWMRREYPNWYIAYFSRYNLPMFVTSPVVCGILGVLAYWTW